MEKRKAHFLNWVDTMWDVDGRCRTEVPSRKGNEVKGNLVGNSSNIYCRLLRTPNYQRHCQGRRHILKLG